MSRHSVTDFLLDWSRGDREALNKLIPIVTMNCACGRRYLPHLFLGRALEQKGMHKEALAAYQKAADLEVGTRESMVMIGHLHAISGKRAEAMKILGDLRELYEQKKGSAYDLAVIYAGLSRRDEALEWPRRLMRNAPAVCCC